MDEAGQQTPHPAKKRDHAILLYAAALLLALYVLSPALIIYPIYRSTDRRAPGIFRWLAKPMQIAVYPLTMLATASPQYARFLVWECHLMSVEVSVKKP